MYKIYIENEDNQYINQLSQQIKKELLKNDNLIVYLDENSDITRLELDAHLIIQSGEKDGPEVVVKETQMISNGLAKEVCKELEKVYYNNINRGVLYKTKILENENDNMPEILILISNLNNKEDVKWLVESCDRISAAICKGVVRSFELKQC